MTLDQILSIVSYTRGLSNSVLNENNINWTNKIDEEFYYEWGGKVRRYYPDFYLPDYDFYIEVKGYERDRKMEM